jgi:hypothetical protein
VSDLPERQRRDAGLSRRLTNEEFEMVIRRAAELQARSPEETGAEGVSEADVVRIGQELGLSAAHVGRALAEVRAGASYERGVAARLMGVARLAVSRAVPGDAAALARALETYLTGQEYMIVQRRLPDRVVLVRASGAAAAIARTATELFRRVPLLGMENLEFSVRQLEPGTAYVGLATDLSGNRTGHLVGAGVMGGVFGAVGAGSLSLAIGPAAVLVAVPLVAASLGGMRLAYRSEARKTLVKLESLLDRIEHGELAGGPGRR